jgi:hypothetical protein
MKRPVLLVKVEPQYPETAASGEAAGASDRSGRDRRRMDPSSRSKVLSSKNPMFTCGLLSMPVRNVALLSGGR